MHDTRWSTPALMARIDLAIVLDGKSRVVSAERARLRLDFLNVVSAVDGGRMSSDEALGRLETMLDTARAAA
ncbi:hypothetical protein [Herbiconiux liangxiaofengii]|uniref:hypothetical protein n=1 Tax=Herbiconiux liangxiaofengii TaxID=3342795 RepID=UPI0035BB1D04